MDIFDYLPNYRRTSNQRKEIKKKVSNITKLVLRIYKKTITFFFCKFFKTLYHIEIGFFEKPHSVSIIHSRIAQI